MTFCKTLHKKYTPIVRRHGISFDGNWIIDGNLYEIILAGGGCFSTIEDAQRCLNKFLVNTRIADMVPFRLPHCRICYYANTYYYSIGARGPQLVCNACENTYRQ